jgi:hypothetical protein
MSNFWKTSNGQAATGVNETTEFATIPKGDRKGLISKTEIKDGDYGKKISLQFTITEGEFKKRTFFTNINLYLPANYATLKEDDKQKAITKQDKAINLMVGLFNALGVALPQCDPADIKAIDLARLCNKPVIIDMYPFMPKPDAGGEQKGPFYLANNFKKATSGAAKPQTKNEAEDTGHVVDHEKQPASTEPDLAEDYRDVPF